VPDRIPWVQPDAEEEGVLRPCRYIYDNITASVNSILAGEGCFFKKIADGT